jgi:tripartite-type tricarboxylate transporter receptor subunit TctC
MSFRVALGCLTAVAAVAGLAQPGQAADPFFKGKTIVTLISTTPGGAYDLVARTTGKHLPKYIEGNPNVVVQSMAGAGGVTLSNHLYNIAPKDGTTIGVLNQGLGMSQIFTDTQYQTAKFEWIGRVASTTGLVFVHKSAPVQSLEGMKTKELIFSSAGKGSQTYILPTMMRTLLGLKTKVILGYNALPDEMLAMERGEIHARTGDIAALKTARPEWLEDGTIKAIGEFTLEDKPSLPGVPLLMNMPEAAKNKELLELIGAYTAFGFPYAAPPGTPRDRVEMFRKAFDSVMKDPEFLADMERVKITPIPESGQYLQGLAGKFADISPAVVAKAKEAVEW